MIVESKWWAESEKMIDVKNKCHVENKWTRENESKNRKCRLDKFYNQGKLGFPFPIGLNVSDMRVDFSVQKDSLCLKFRKALLEFVQFLNH